MMKIITRTIFGGPEVLSVTQKPIPKPKDDEVLCKIEAVSLNAADRHVLRGDPYILRLVMGCIPTLGTDVAGVVHELPKNSSDNSEFKVGDKVVGKIIFGGLAEYVCVPKKDLVKIPANISVRQAAAIPLAGMTSLQGLRDYGKIKAGQSVLVTGAAGGCGSLGVAIAKAYGCHVTAVCRGSKTDVALAMGADKVLDYEKEDFSTQSDKYDCILDCAATLPLGRASAVLKPNGQYVLLGSPAVSVFTPLSVLIRKPWYKWIWGRSINVFVAEDKPKDVQELMDMAKDGKLTPFIDETKFSLDESADALRHWESRKTRGKIVIDV